MARARRDPAVGVAKRKGNAMMTWMAAGAVVVLVLAALIPLIARARALVRQWPTLFETHGAANDPHY